MKMKMVFSLKSAWKGRGAGHSVICLIIPVGMLDCPSSTKLLFVSDIGFELVHCPERCVCTCVHVCKSTRGKCQFDISVYS